MESVGHLLAMGHETAEKVERELNGASYLEFRWGSISYCARHEDYFWLVPNGSPIHAGVPFISRAITAKEQPDSGLRSASVGEQFAEVISRYCPVRNVADQVSLV